MFPWSAEFIWDAAHIAFFGAFYSVLLSLGVVAGLSLRRARANARAGRTADVAWRAEFEDLPARDRACRHEMTGEAPGRVCDNAFDCRSCAAHPSFMALRTADRPAGDAAAAGLRLPLDCRYHRGHTFVRVEADGTATVGLDDMARRLVGEPDSVTLPPPGTQLGVNAPAWRIRTRGSDVRVLSPLDGVVIGAEGSGADVLLHVDPRRPLDVSHLLSGAEVGPWALRELERLQGLLGSRELGPAMADGGELLADLGPELPPARLDAVLGEMFLDL
jgi:hypothetical protein